MKPLAKALAALWFLCGTAGLSGCGTTGWTGAREKARGDEVAESELALAMGEPAEAAALAEAALAKAMGGSPNGGGAGRVRAFLTLVAACDALGQIERPLLHLPGALETAIALDLPREAEWIVAQAPRAWGRLDGQSAASPEVKAALVAVTKTTGDRWERARSAALTELVTAARLGGGPARAREAAKAAGFLQDWRLSAPWGDAPLLDFDTALGPESRPLAASEATGAGYGLEPVATTTGTFSDGEVTFFDFGPTGGVGFAETTLTVPAADAGVRVFRLEANRLARVFVASGDEAAREVVARVDLDGPWLSEAALKLGAGTWRVTVKFASHDGRGFFRLQVGARDGLLEGGPREPVLKVGDGRSAVARLIALERRAARPVWDPRGAQAELAELARVLGPHPSLELLAARLALGDVTAPESERRELARGHYRAVLAKIPGQPMALRGLARLEREEQRLDAAYELLSRSTADVPMGGRPPVGMEAPMGPSTVSLGPAPASAVASGPSSGVPPAPAAALRGPSLPFIADPRTALELLDLLRSRGWEVESLKLAESLMPLASYSPRLSQELIDTWRAFGRFAEAQRLTEQLEMAFPGTGTERLAELATDRGQPPADPLVGAWEAEPERHASLRSAVAALRAKGDLVGAEALLERFVRSRPHDGWALGELARVALQKGDVAQAQQRARAVLEKHPDFAPFEGLLSQLAGEPERFDVLADGPALVAAYRRFAESAEGKGDAGYPVVTVYDRVELEVRRDGSTLEVSHRIRLVQSKQGADALGDVRPPDGARLLVARTLKRDGRLLEPERTEGKADLSFPELEPGDAVETAWVSRSRVSPSEGGYLTGVAFASWNPVHRLEARVVAERGLDIATSVFGKAPAPKRATLADGRRELRWEIDRIAPTPREPLTVSARSFFPFVDLRVVRADEVTDPGAPAKAWALIARAYAARIMRLTAKAARVEAKVDELARQADPVAAAYSFVKRDIGDAEQLNTFETAVEAALASKKGNRTLVLYALLEALASRGGAQTDTEVELLVCAPERDGTPEDRDQPTPNANRYFYPVVRWSDAERTLFMDPSRPYTPLGDLPAELNGARCLAPSRHAQAAPFFELPRTEAEPTFELVIELDLDAKGDARGRVLGEAQGAAASPLRQAFIAQDPERRRMIFEQWLGTLYAGARLVELEVKDADESEKPMRWTASFEVIGLAQEDKGHLAMRGLAKGLVAGDFAGVPELTQLVSAPSRQTPLRVLPYAEDVEFRVRLPKGYVLVAAPRDHEVRLGPAKLVQRVDKSPGLVVVRREVRLVNQRVEPSAYPEVRDAVARSLFAFEGPIGVAPKDHASIPEVAP